MNSAQRIVRWSHRNLFATKSDIVLSVVFIPLCFWIAGSIAVWALTVAQWQVVAENLRVLMVGTYPIDMMWRPWSSALILSFLCGSTLGAVAIPARGLLFGCLAAVLCAAGIGAAANHMAWALSGAAIALVLAGWAATGLVAGLRKAIGAAWLVALIAIAVFLAPAGLERWGGLLISILFTLLASVLSVPLGVALALGRRSRFVSARMICTAYIEIMRSLPLILVVYCIWIVLPLLMPGSPGPDLLRGLIGFTLFFAAYVAEYVRSGLQGIPRGQVEAAQSLGLSSAQVSRDIVLPQAIRVVMPALVGNVLDVFNTVPLLFIIGMTDFLRAGQMVLVNPRSGNRTYEVYAFMFLVYLLIASVITYGARRLETRMALGHR